MPRPKKINTENNETNITKPSNDNIIQVNKKIFNNYIITDKVGNYYFDEYYGVWDNNMILIGAYKSNDEIYLYNNIKKIINKNLQIKL